MTDPAKIQEERVRGVLAFLKGEGPLDGVWFGDSHPTYAGAFWWRAFLPDAFAASGAGGAGEEAQWCSGCQKVRSVDCYRPACPIAPKESVQVPEVGEVDLDCRDIATVRGDAAFLSDLAHRMFTTVTPAMGFDQGDTDQLYRIARNLRALSAIPSPQVPAGAWEAGIEAAAKVARGIASAENAKVLVCSEIEKMRFSARASCAAEIAVKIEVLRTPAADQQEAGS